MVRRGIEGFGAHSRVHTTKIRRLSEDLSIAVGIADLPERIGRFLPVLDETVAGGMITVENVRVVVYRSGSGPTRAPA